MKNTKGTKIRTRIITAAMAALMLTTTAFSFQASAADRKTTMTAQQVVEMNLKDKSYQDVLDEWQKIMADPMDAFPGGCDLDGDGVETEEEKNEVADKLKEYAAGMTVGLMKMGLNACCDGLADCFEGPLKDFTNALFDVPQEASNDDIMNKLDDTTQQIIGKINDSEKNIINKVNDLDVAKEYGNAFDQLEAKATTARSQIKQAMSAKTGDEKTVAIASKLGDMDDWGKNPLVDQMGIAKIYATSGACTTHFENGYNLYDIAFRTSLDKGSLFMKEAVENSQFYIAQCTNKYVKSCVTLLEMLTAMQQVDQMTDEQVAAMSKAAQKDYFKLKDHADQAAFYEAEILSDMFGKDGIVTKSRAYVERKVTEPTTYVGRGMTDHIKLSPDLDYHYDISFIEPYYERHLSTERNDWRWRKDSDTGLINASGLKYGEVEKICKHAFELGYTVENYLKANGFNVKKIPNYNKHVLVTGHFDEYHGTNWKGYTAYEGFNGYDVTKKYGKNAGAAQWKLIRKHQLGLWVPSCDEWRIADYDVYMFFVKA